MWAGQRKKSAKDGGTYNFSAFLTRRDDKPVVRLALQVDLDHQRCRGCDRTDVNPNSASGQMDEGRTSPSGFVAGSVPVRSASSANAFQLGLSSDKRCW